MPFDIFCSIASLSFLCFLRSKVYLVTSGQNSWQELFQENLVRGRGLLVRSGPRGCRVSRNNIFTTFCHGPADPIFNPMLLVDRSQVHWSVRKWLLRVLPMFLGCQMIRCIDWWELKSYEVGNWNIWLILSAVHSHRKEMGSSKMSRSVRCPPVWFSQVFAALLAVINSKLWSTQPIQLWRLRVRAIWGYIKLRKRYV